MARGAQERRPAQRGVAVAVAHARPGGRDEGDSHSLDCDDIDAETLIAELRAARARTRAVADDLGGERELGPQLAIVNPPRWEIGHVGWFQEWWCLRQVRAKPGRRFCRTPTALYNSATVAHATRWGLPLPSFRETLAYRDEVTERVDRNASRQGDADALLRAARACATRRCTPKPSTTRGRRSAIRPARARPARIAAPGDLEYAGGVFRLGSSPGEGFVFDNEKWSHPLVLQPFRISRGCVTNARVRAIREGRAASAPRYWRRTARCGASTAGSRSRPTSR